MSTYLPAVFGEDLMDVFEDLDRGFFRGWNGIDRTLYGKHARNMMKTDVKETDSAYELEIDLPGFKKDEISLDLQDGYLNISTERSLEKSDGNGDGRLLRRERWSGSMRRSFYVGEHLTEEDIRASYEDGVLRITVPKKEAPRIPEKKTIMIA